MNYEVCQFDFWKHKFLSAECGKQKVFSPECGKQTTSQLKFQGYPLQISDTLCSCSFLVLQPYKLQPPGPNRTLSWSSQLRATARLCLCLPSLRCSLEVLPRQEARCPQVLPLISLSLLGVRDHCCTLPDNQCLKLIVSYILCFIVLVIKGVVNSNLVSLSWPVVEESHILLGLIMNFLKTEENTSFSATGNDQSTRPEAAKVCVLFFFFESPNFKI